MQHKRLKFIQTTTEIEMTKRMQNNLKINANYQIPKKIQMHSARPVQTTSPGVPSSSESPSRRQAVRIGIVHRSRWVTTSASSTTNGRSSADMSVRTSWRLDVPRMARMARLSDCDEASPYWGANLTGHNCQREKCCREKILDACSKCWDNVRENSAQMAYCLKNYRKN